MQRNQGLTTKAAINQLITQLKQFSENYESKNKLYHLRLSSAIDWILSGIYAVLLIVSMILTGYEYGDIIVIFLIILFVLIDIILHKKQIKFKEQKTLNQLSEVIKQFQLQNQQNFYLTITNSSNQKAFTNESAQLISILRDGRWEKIMKPLIVKNDIIQLISGDVACTKMKCVQFGFQNITLINGEVFQNPSNGASPMNDSNRRKYKFQVQKSVFINNLEKYFNLTRNDDKICRTSYHQSLGKLIKCVKFFSFCAILLTALLVIIWAILTRQDQNHAYMEFIRHPIFIIFIALGIGINILMRVIDGWSQNQIKQLINCLQEEDYNQMQIQYGDVVREQHIFQRADSYYEKQNFQKKNFKKKLPAAIKSICNGVPRDQNLAVSLANTTKLCFIDNQGIVSQNTKYVDQIALLGRESSKIVIDALHDPNHINEEDAYSFEDKNIITDQMALIKPLALAMSQTRNPFVEDDEESPKNDKSRRHGQSRFTMSSQIQAENESNQYSSSLQNLSNASKVPFAQCFCGLSQKIGYSWQILDGYKCIKQQWEFKKPLVREISQKQKTICIVDEVAKSNDIEIFNKSQINCDEGKSLFSDEQEKRKNTDIADEIPVVKSLQQLHSNVLIRKIKQSKKIRHPKIKLPILVANIIQDIKQKSVQLFCRGDVKTVLAQCSFYWDGQELVKLDELDRHNIVSIYNQWEGADLDSVAFSYRPLKLNQGDSQLDVPQKNINTGNSIFLGMVSLKYHPKTEVKKLFEKFGKVGTRCVLFSRQGNPQTIALGNQLGLQTQWNSIISLSSEADQEYLDRNKLGRIVMPFGISGIRERLEQNQDVPLLVNMFCDATADTIQQMVEIFRQQGEVVTVIGSAFNCDSFAIFGQADIAFALQMRPLSHCMRCLGKTDNKNITATSFERLAMKLISLPCSFTFKPNINLFCFYSIFRKARNLTQNALRASIFYCTLNICLFLPLFIEIFIGLPSALGGYALAYILLVLAPLLSYSFVFGVKQSNEVMAYRTTKLKISQYLISQRKIFYCITSKLIITTVFITILDSISHIDMLKAFRNSDLTQFNAAYENQSNITNLFFKQQLFGDFIKNLYTYPKLQQLLSFFKLARFGIWIIVVSVLGVGFRDAYRSIFKKRGKNNFLALFILIHMLLGISLFVIVQVIFGDWFIAILQTLLLLTWIFIIVLLDEVFKYKMRNVYREKDQDIMKMFYVTKLGLHSPE